MNVSAWSIRRPVPSILLFVLLTLIGLIAFSRLQVQGFPDMDLPTIQVSAVLEGAAPAQLESDVARRIEDRLASLDRLDHIATTITDGSVSMRVIFALEKDGEQALGEVRNAIESVRAELPAGMPPPTVTRQTAAPLPMMTFAIESDRLDEQALSWFIDNDVAKALLAVGGVARIGRMGGIEREVHVDLDPTLMAGLGVAPADVSRRLKAVQSDSSGGLGQIGGQRQSARTLADVDSIDDVAALTVPLADGRYVRLDQIGHVVDGHAERATRAFLDGRPVIGVQVTRALGYSDLDVAARVRAAMTTFAAAHSEVRIVEVNNTVEPVRDNYEGSMALLYEGAILAILVVWWFLRDGRATLIAATALPLSILPAFAFMALIGYSLNTVTLLALSLVVGVLVDDAIVEIENIDRHLRMGKRPFQAAMEAADEIGAAVIATTLTLVAVFLPTAFMGGIPGLVFRQFGITASVAVMASLLVARMLTPMLAAYLLRPPAHGPGETPPSPLMRRYLGWVRLALRHRRVTAATAAALFAVSLAVLPLLPTGFMPVQDRAQTTVTLELAPGSTLHDTVRVSLHAGELLRGLPEVAGVFAAVGTVSRGDGLQSAAVEDVRRASLTVDLVPRQARALTQAEVEARMRAVLRTLPGVRVAVGGPGGGEQLTLTLAGEDAQALDRAAAQLETELRGLRGIGQVSSSAALQRPEVQLRPDAARAAAFGITADTLAEAVRMATYGDYATTLPRLNLPQRQVPIRVRMDPAVSRDLDAIGRIRVPGRDAAVSLAAVADLALGSGPAQIDRLDRARNVTVTVELNGRAIGDVQREALALPALKSLPAGVRRVEQGEAQRMTELFRGFALAMAVGIFCIWALLVLLFHDFLQPATILSALPLALSGALFSLWATGQPFSMPALIGVLMLMGIVTKNSILLVEYAIVARRRHGLARFDALVDACRKRARPIVMTTLAMGAGMLPNALGLGAEPSFRQPMAIAVIGGLLASTALSLIVVPVVFSYVDDLLQALKTRLGTVYEATVAEPTSP